MQDIFLEKIVCRAITPAVRLRQGAILLAAAVLICLAIVFGGSFLGAILTVAVCWGARLLIQRQQVEYEYSVTNGELDVDIIYARQSRKHLFTVAPGRVEELEPWKGGRMDGQVKVADCTSGLQTEDRWRLLFRTDHGRQALLFEPSQAMVDSIRKYASLGRR